MIFQPDRYLLKKQIKNSVETMVVKNKILQNISPLCLILVFAIGVFWQVLFANKIFSDQYAFSVYYPNMRILKDSLATAGSIPVWNSHVLSGFPFYATETGFLWPVNFAVLFLNYITAYHIVILVNFFLAGVMMYWLAKNLGLSMGGGLIAALTYMFSQWMMLWGKQTVLSNFFFVPPMIFLAILKIGEGQKIFILPVIFGIFVGLTLTYTAFILYTLVAGLFFLFFLTAFKDDERPRFLIKRYWLLGIAVAIGALLSVPFILSVIKFTSMSSRSGGLSASQALLSGGRVGLTTLPRLMFPQFHIPFITNDQAIYFGVLSLFFAISAVFWFWKDKFVKFFTFLFIFSFAASFGFPLFWLMNKLPLLHLFRSPEKWLLISVFSVSILAGFGLDSFYIKDGPALKKFSKILSWIFAFTISLAVIIDATFKYFYPKVFNWSKTLFIKYIYAGTTQKSIGHYDDLIRQTLSEFVKNFSFLNYQFLIIIFLVLGFAILLHLFSRNKIGGKFFGISAIALAALQFILPWQDSVFFLTKEILKPHPGIIYLEEYAKDYRVVNFSPGLTEYINIGLNTLDVKMSSKFNIGFLYPDTNNFYDIDIIYGQEPLMTRREIKLLAAISPANTSFGEHLGSKKESLNEKIKIFTSPENLKLMSMMNVRHVITAFPFPDTIGLKKIFNGTIPGTNLPFLIYENVEALPRVYFAKNVITSPESEDAAYPVLGTIKDFSKTTLIECTDCSEIKQFARIGSKNDNIILKSQHPGDLVLETNLNGPRLLVYSESYFPDWELKIDGQPAKLYRANFLYQAGMVQSGRHIVEFKYPGLKEQLKNSLKNFSWAEFKNL